MLGSVLISTSQITSLKFYNNPMKYEHHYLYLADDEIETWGGQETCTRSVSKPDIEDLDLGSVSRPRLLTMVPVNPSKFRDNLQRDHCFLPPKGIELVS